jgi:histidyl-tRNA synthetase
LLAELRESGLAADRAYGGRSLKKQMTAADRSGARWAVIIGSSEVERGVVAVRDLRSEQPLQQEVRRDEIAAWLRTEIDKAPS